jgi:hypothetical protein
VGELKSPGKSFDISKWEVQEAYEKVRANKGAPGVDGCSIEDFEKDLKNNLYRVWNRLSSDFISTRQRQRAFSHRSSSRTPPDTVEPCLFPRRSPQRSSANAARGGLEPLPAERLWRTNKPPSLIQHRAQRSTIALHLPRSCSQQDPEVPARLPRPVRQHRGRPDVLRPILRLVTSTGTPRSACIPLPTSTTATPTRSARPAA